MKNSFEKYKNPDGKTGIDMLSEISGLSKEEVRWTFFRLKELIIFEGKTKEEAKEIVAEEVKKKPWENA